MSIPSRNDPCPCGSGKKYKKCCLDKVVVTSTTNRQTASQAIQIAWQHHKAGNLPQAEAIYRRILQENPEQPDALYLLGSLAHQAGNHEIATEITKRTITANPNNPVFHISLGSTYQALNCLDEAVACYQKALALKPDYFDAHYNLGTVFQMQNKLDEAVCSYIKALALNPNFAEAHNNLGSVFREQRKLDEAVTCYQKALALNPDFAGAHNNLGNVFKDQGNLGEATAHYQKALAFNPAYAEAHYNLGIVLQLQEKLGEAAKCFQQALLFNPNYVEAYNNLGNVLKDQNKLDEAVENYRKALSLKPGYVEAHYNLGNALKDQSKLDEAVENYRKALSLKPDYVDAHYNLGNTLRNQGKLDDSVGHYRKALSLKPDYVDAYSNLLFLYSYHALLDPREYLAQACGWEQACVALQDRQAAHDRTFQRPSLAGRRLKVGYVSGDYWQHAVSYFVEQLFAHHDRSRVELFAYSTNSKHDSVTGRLQTLVDHWVSLAGFSNATAQERIEADGVDVLIDLSGYTAYNRLGIFACRVAPVQAHYLGYFASTGLTEMDYWIGDEVMTPPETDGHFSEQVWRLPRVWVSYDDKTDAPLPGWHPAQDNTLWVGSFNNLGKLTPATLALWAKVLHALPEARLLLKARQLADEGNRRRILDGMAEHGIAPDRIELRDSSITPGWPAHMAYYDRLDIALDPVGGVGGGTTTCDALWMGVPVITLTGDRMASRMTASMLDAIGHPEWVARSEAEYVGKVVALARDMEQRKALRSTQRERMARSPLCDAKGLAANLENAYFGMFERWFDLEAVE